MKTRGRPRYPDILTPRQQDVLACLREGLTNEEIAQRLGITLDGAKFHVSEILLRLGVDSRYEAANWSPEHEPARGRWAFVLAPFALLHRAKWSAASYAAATVVVLGAAVGVALLAWGVMRTGGHVRSTQIDAGATPETMTYRNPEYGISLTVPSNWVPDSRYGSALDGTPLSYHAPGEQEVGYFVVGGVGGSSLDAVADALTQDPRYPPGQSRAITDVTVPAGNGRFIVLESTETQFRGAQFDIAAPAMSPTGTDRYLFPYVVLNGWPAQMIMQLARSIRFIDPHFIVPPSPPVSPPGGLSSQAAIP
ncbi:MAG TPA: helix-turn-helix transcriptional regulator [Gemmatimonadaceae bacterium]